MRQFLRYEISGLVFIVWFFLFYNIDNNTTLESFYEIITQNIVFKDNILFAIIAFPLGAIIHQISVNIKNWIIAPIAPELNDSPKSYLKTIVNNNNFEYTNYILERISNLNSFYYVRFDNGFLAPFSALVINLMLGKTVNSWLLLIFIIIAILLLGYIPRIIKEIKEYEELLNNLKPKKSYKNVIENFIDL